MDARKAVAWAGSQKELARRLGVTEGAVSQWVKAGRIPVMRAYQIQVISAGAVVADKVA